MPSPPSSIAWPFGPVLRADAALRQPPALAPLAALHQLPTRPAATAAAPALFVIAEGTIATARALLAGHAVEVVLATPAKAGTLLRELEHEAARAGLAVAAPARPLPLVLADRDELQAWVGFDLHRGCVSVVRRPDARATAPWCDGAPPPTASMSRVLVAEALADPSNLGALIRNARALGADAVICGAGGADPFERRAIRAAMGHGFALPIAVVEDLARWVDAWRAPTTDGPRRAAWALTTGPHARSLIELCAVEPARPALPNHLALLLGNEGRGLTDALRDRADMEVTIPLAPAVDSLNVAATSAVVLFALATSQEITSRDDPASSHGRAR